MRHPVSHHTNRHVARSVLDCCVGSDAKVDMVPIDLEKVFGRARHDVIFYPLAYVGFGIASNGISQLYDSTYHQRKLN